MTLPMFAYRGMLCRISGMTQTGLVHKDPRAWLYELTPVHGGCEIPNVRYDEFEPAGENVFPIFPPTAPFVSGNNERTA